MSEQEKTWTYNMEDIFEDIPDSPEEVMMKLPPEVAEEVGLVPGDKIKILIGDQGTLIIEKVKDNNGEEQ